MTPLLRGYLLALTAPAVALTSALLGLPAGSPGDPALMAVLCILGAVSTTYPVMVAARYKADVSPAVHIAMVLLFPPAIAVALIGASGLLGEGALCLRRDPATGTPRRLPIDLVFNTSQLMLAGGLSAVAFRAGGAGLPAAAIAAVVMYAVSTGLVVIAAGLHNRRSPMEIWAEAASADLKQTGALYAAGYLLAIISNGRPALAL